MKNKAFTLFEVLISLVILSVMILSISKIYTNDDMIERYYDLQNIENTYIETNTINNTENIILKQN